MSVHGEYSRALEALLVCVQRLEGDSASQWAGGLTNARSSQQPDLSSAAKACLVVLDAIDSERALSSPPDIGPDADPLRGPFGSLRAHCHALLGTPDQPKETG
jgi:hypothetical protein